MTQEQKELLLKDLSGRLPYGVVIQEKCLEYDEMFLPDVESNRLINIDMDTEVLITNGWSKYHIDDVKPYLFPLSSMTEEQKKEYTHIVNYIDSDDTENWKEGEFIYVEQISQLMHFYHRHHLDHRGLIPMGLAIDATNLNIY